MHDLPGSVPDLDQIEVGYQTGPFGISFFPGRSIQDFMFHPRFISLSGKTLFFSHRLEIIFVTLDELKSQRNDEHEKHYCPFPIYTDVVMWK